jgi:hypothetical protein
MANWVDEMPAAGSYELPNLVESTPKPKSAKSRIDWARQRAAEALAAADKRAAETPCQMFLPGFDLGAMPNHINRSSMYAPIARGRRQYHRQQPLFTLGRVTMNYTGEQLDEADADLTMALIFAARDQPIGTPVTTNLAALLRSMGRNTGKHDYDWLYRRMKALTEATLFIEARKPDGSAKYRIGHAEVFHIVQQFHYDPDAKNYTYTLDSRWVALFGNREYALLDWAKRLQIGRGQDMAKALQRLIATSSDQVQRYGLDLLKRKFEYRGRLRDFKASIERATRELERLCIVASGRIERSTKHKEQLAIWLW